MVALVNVARVDAVGVLEVGADVGVGVVDARVVAATPGTAADLRGAGRACAATPGRRGRDDVGAERQLGVDPRLLVVGGGEDRRG